MPIDGPKRDDRVGDHVHIHVGKAIESLAVEELTVNEERGRRPGPCSPLDLVLVRLVNQVHQPADHIA